MFYKYSRFICLFSFLYWIHYQNLWFSFFQILICHLSRALEFVTLEPHELLYFLVAKTGYKPQNPKLWNIYWINIIKLYIKIKGSPKMGIEPMTITKSQPMNITKHQPINPTKLSPRKPWHLQRNEFFISWNGQTIPRLGNPHWDFCLQLLLFYSSDNSNDCVCL